MGRRQTLAEAIAPGAIVSIDTMAFIYQIEESPTYVPIVEPFFVALADGRFSAVTSVITLMEMNVVPLRLDRPDVADQYETLLRSYPNLTIVGVDRAITRRAAQLRAERRMRPVDALQVATGLERGASHFVTNDYDLEGLTAIEVVIIDDFLPGGRPKPRPAR